MLILTPLLMLALAARIDHHDGGKPRRFGLMVGDPERPIHLWKRPSPVDPANWNTEVENGPIAEFNRSHGVRVASR